MGVERPLDFFEFIYDRQLVWHNRYVKKMPRPWTTNPILDKYKFTECYRENDRCTKYLIERVVNHNKLNNAQKVFAILVFRIFNQEGLFDNYFKCVPAYELFEARVLVKDLDDAKAKGLNLFNNAYNITQRTYCYEWRKGEKHVQHLLNLENIARRWDNIFIEIQKANTAKQIFSILCSLNFFGPFLAGQCLTDISYIKDFKFNVDFNEWYPVGPGAKGGLDVYSACVIKDYEAACKSVWCSQEQMFRELYQKTGKDWFLVKYARPYYQSDYLSLNNIQNCFCEYRKYLNYKSGELKRIKYYKPKE